MIKCSPECNLRSATLQPAEIGVGRRKNGRKGSSREFGMWENPETKLLILISLT